VFFNVVLTVLVTAFPCEIGLSLGSWRCKVEGPLVMTLPVESLGNAGHPTIRDRELCVSILFF
jgi:hypothetical protein